MDLKKRIVEIAFKHKLGHLGSYLSSVEIINEIYSKMDKDEKNKIHCSTGSLGLGLPIALGRALANPNRKVWVLISDGEAAEGSIWESLKTIQELNINNIEVFVNINGLCAYKEVNIDYMSIRLKSFLPRIELRYTTVEQYPFLKGLNAHYHVMSEENYNQVMDI
jgi:transketolase N-terminal domain/subunit